MQSTEPTQSSGNAILTLLEPLAPEWVPGWLVGLTAIGVSVGIVTGMIALIAMFSVWLERKVSAHIQCRYGPMYPGGWHGWAVVLADGLKLIMKEDMIPKGADKVLFVLAPALVLASIFGAMAAFPFAPNFYFARMDLGIFMILAISSTTTIGVVMAGWASNSKWSLYGAMREAAQVVAYEIPLGISLMVPLMTLGTFSLLEASEKQAGYQGAEEEVADGDRESVCHQDEHDAGWNQDAEGSHCTDGSSSKARCITGLEHGRQAQERKQDDGGADDAGARGQDDADQCDRDREPTPHSTKESRDIAHQIRSDPRTVEQQAHTDEHRQGDEDPVVHQVPDPVGHERGIAPIDAGEMAKVLLDDDGDRCE